LRPGVWRSVFFAAAATLGVVLLLNIPSAVIETLANQAADIGQSMEYVLSRLRINVSSPRGS
jgi:hypothetical protein